MKKLLRRSGLVLLILFYLFCALGTAGDFLPGHDLGGQVMLSAILISWVAHNGFQFIVWLRGVESDEENTRMKARFLAWLVAMAPVESDSVRGASGHGE